MKPPPYGLYFKQGAIGGGGTHLASSLWPWGLGGSQARAGPADSRLAPRTLLHPEPDGRLTGHLQQVLPQGIPLTSPISPSYPGTPLHHTLGPPFFLLRFLRTDFDEIRFFGNYCGI